MMHGSQIPNQANKLWIASDDIVALRSVRNYTEIIHTNGKKFLFSRTLKIVAQRLAASEQFFRVSRGSFINLNEVSHYCQIDFSLEIHLSNGDVEVVSRRRQMDFLTAFTKVNKAS